MSVPPPKALSLPTMAFMPCKMPSAIGRMLPHSDILDRYRGPDWDHRPGFTGVKTAMRQEHTRTTDAIGAVQTQAEGHAEVAVASISDLQDYLLYKYKKPLDTGKRAQTEAIGLLRGLRRRRNGKDEVDAFPMVLWSCDLRGSTHRFFFFMEMKYT
jgi:hypothetical protein